MSDNDNYEAVRRVLTNIRSARVLARETDFEQLLEMQEKFNAVIDERREEAEKEAQERQAREKKRQELLEIISAEGFSAAELLGEGAETQTKRKNKLPKAPPKYQYEENGTTKYWSGRGRAPKPIDAALKDGKKLEDFLIKSSQASPEEV